MILLAVIIIMFTVMMAYFSISVSCSASAASETHISGCDHLSPGVFFGRPYSSSLSNVPPQLLGTVLTTGVFVVLTSCNVSVLVCVSRRKEMKSDRRDVRLGKLVKSVECTNKLWLHPGHDTANTI